MGRFRLNCNKSSLDLAVYNNIKLSTNSTFYPPKTLLLYWKIWQMFWNILFFLSVLDWWTAHIFLCLINVLMLSLVKDKSPLKISHVTRKTHNSLQTGMTFTGIMNIEQEQQINTHIVNYPISHNLFSKYYHIKVRMWC